MVKAKYRQVGKDKIKSAIYVILNEVDPKDSTGDHKGTQTKRRVKEVTGEWWSAGNIRPGMHGDVKTTTNNEMDKGENSKPII